MLELTIHESFPLSDDNKYIDVVASVSKQWGKNLVDLSPSTFDVPSMIEFEFYCVNKCDHPHEISADGHRRVVGALVAAGVLQSVRWKHVLGFIDTFHIDVLDPRVVVRIE
jgi:hypothetical protein